MTKRRRGKPRPDADAKQAAEITPNDVAHAREAWRRDAPAPFRALLDAQPVSKPVAKS